MANEQAVVTSVIPTKRRSEGRSYVTISFELGGVRYETTVRGTSVSPVQVGFRIAVDVLDRGGRIHLRGFTQDTDGMEFATRC